MGDTTPARRRFLAYAGTGVAVAVGGCLDGATDADAPKPAADPPTTTPTETATDQPTPDPAMSTVFHFSGGVSAQNHAVANVANLLNDDSVDLGDVALVANGSGLELLVEDESTVADDVRSLLGRGVTFYACHNSMAALDVAEDDLLDPDIEVVPAGVGTLTKLQADEGYAYIKTP